MPAGLVLRYITSKTQEVIYFNKDSKAKLERCYMSTKVCQSETQHNRPNIHDDTTDQKKITTMIKHNTCTLFISGRRLITPPEPEGIYKL